MVLFFQDDTVGMSPKEERELKKALYASLHESRRPQRPMMEEEIRPRRVDPRMRKLKRLSLPVSSKEKQFKTRTRPSRNADESSQDSSASSLRESKK
jgi:hypothetical protein